MLPDGKEEKTPKWMWIMITSCDNIVDEIIFAPSQFIQFMQIALFLSQSQRESSLKSGSDDNETMMF
jgi:hypothetical protein